nr:MAG TPA: hypothetical protein [Caudoviricetes sp.]
MVILNRNLWVEVKSLIPMKKGRFYRLHEGTHEVHFSPS